MVYQEVISAISAKAEFWLTVSSVCAWASLGFSLLAAVILIVKVKRGY